MQAIAFYVILFLSAIMVQFGWNQYLAVAGLAPDFILISVIFLGLFRGPMPAQVAGFFWGISWDALSVDLFGAHAFLFTGIGYLIGHLRRKLNETKVVNQMILAWVATVFLWLGKYVLYQIFGQGEAAFGFNHIVLLQPFYNMLVAPLVFAAGQWLMGVFVLSMNEA